MGWLLRNRIALAVIILVDIGGIAYGYRYYQEQLAQTPVWFWPFVPDSPNAVAIFLLALTLLLAGRRQPWLEVVGSVAMLKVGIWTAFVLVFHADFFLVGPERDFRLVILVLHLVMALEPAILLDRAVRIPRWQWAAILGWFLANDALDYGLGLSPWIPDRDLQVVAAVTVTLTLLCFLVCWRTAEAVLRKRAASRTRTRT